MARGGRVWSRDFRAEGAAGSWAVVRVEHGVEQVEAEGAVASWAVVEGTRGGLPH